MRLALALALLLAAEPASAHCYSVWKYPRPQHCGVRLAAHSEARRQLRAAALAVPIPPAPVADDRWYVEITRMPDGLDEDRAIGIEALKKALGSTE